MPDFLDTEIWIGLIALTAVLYLIKFLQSRSKRTVYRVSPESLKKSKEVMLKVLPLVEGEEDRQLIDKRRLPYTKDNVKSAAKILAYYYWKKDQQTELMRVKNAYISLARFQDADTESYVQESQFERDKSTLTKEFELYLAHTSINSKAA